MTTEQAPGNGGEAASRLGGAAHVWYCWTDRCLTSDRSAFYRSLLSPDERARLERLVMERSRREFLVTRALCRTTLSRYADVDPARWRFTTNRHGRPEILEPASALRFNLTNARSIVALIVTDGSDAGIDAEETDRRRRTLALAERFFAPREIAALRSLPRARQVSRFFEYWTLKESYLKARGVGLRIPLRQFCFELERDRIRIVFEPELQDRSERWQFALFRPSERHQLAIAVRRPEGPDWPIVVREVIPGA